MSSGFIAVHTGAGNFVIASKYKPVCRRACSAATGILVNDGGSAFDACVAAIKELEDSGETNAGFGSNLTWTGDVECDASVMDGRTGLFGACTNVSRIRNPITLAQTICKRQSRLLNFGRIPPMVMAGTGAEEYAHEMGIEMITDKEEMISKKALKSYNYHKKEIDEYAESNDLQNLSALDTVGAICVDSHGNIAAGCSSGGILLKVNGRVGQAATYGAGCWAWQQDATKESIATCTTGNGEYLMKTLLAKEIVDDLRGCECPITTLNQTFKSKFIESPYLRGLDEIFGGALTILYDQEMKCGELLWSHTTKFMCLAYSNTQNSLGKVKFVASEMPEMNEPGKVTIVSGHHFKF